MKIEIPEGYTFDKVEGGNIILKKNSRVLNWEEFCVQVPVGYGEYFITDSSNVYACKYTFGRHAKYARNCLPSKEDAEAILALMQLIQLRDYANDKWRPDWCNKSQKKYIIYTYGDKIATTFAYSIRKILAFETHEIRNEFLIKNEKLIKIAKDFI